MKWIPFINIMLTEGNYFLYPTSMLQFIIQITTHQILGRKVNLVIFLCVIFRKVIS